MQNPSHIDFKKELNFDPIEVNGTKLNIHVMKNPINVVENKKSILSVGFICFNNETGQSTDEIFIPIVRVATKVDEVKEEVINSLKQKANEMKWLSKEEAEDFSDEE